MTTFNLITGGKYQLQSLYIQSHVIGSVNGQRANCAQSYIPVVTVLGECPNNWIRA